MSHEVRAIALIDLIKLGAEQMTQHLNALDAIYDARTGNFDLQRAFLKEIHGTMNDLRAREARALRERKTRVA